ncbi:MAG: hypothetical protein CVT95_02450, partial [Bacteroidetes bacterium HGW-Bacteroidetes-12]
MKKLLLIFGLLIYFAFSQNINAQITFDNVPPLSGGGNTAGGVSFNFTTNQAITIQNLRCAFSTATGTANIWYNTQKINGAPNVSTANGWVNLGTSAPFAGLSTASTSPVVQTIPIPLNLVMMPQDTFGFFIQWTGNVFPTTNVLIPTFTDGTVTIIADATSAYTGTGTTPTFNPRQINGGVIYILNTPCSGAPTAGTALAPATVCANQSFNLSLSGQSQSSGLNYQWMTGPTATGPWTYITGATTLSYATSQTIDTYYSCEVTCTNSSLADTSASIFVTTNPNLPAGTYTIGASGNYPNFNAAVAAMSCGIAGPVIFNVLPGSGPYNEQITIPQIINANATNTITFNGNGETITFATTASPNNYIIRLDG